MAGASWRLLLGALAVLASSAEPKKLALTSSQTTLSTLNGLADAARDLSVDASKDDSTVSSVDAELSKLQAKRTALLQDASKKKREILLLRKEVQTLGTGLSKSDLAEVVAREGAAQEAKVAAETDAQAEAEAKAAAEMQAQAAAAAKMQAEAAEAQRAAAAAEAKRAAAEAEAQQAAAEAARQKAAAALEAQKAAQVKAASAAASQKAAASQAAAAEQQRAAQAAAQAAAARSASSASSEQGGMTDSTTSASSDSGGASLDEDGLHAFLKGEEGEGEEDDAAYNDSANALADAIGWDRNEVETKANNAVEALTNAIGGKQVVNQVQGMMAGLSAMKR